MPIPAIFAHLRDVEFMYSDNKYYELFAQMGHLIGPSGIILPQNLLLVLL